MRTRLGVATTVAIAVAVSFARPAVGATDTTPPQIVDLQLSPQTFTEDGLHTDLLTVTAQIHDDGSGVQIVNSTFTDPCIASPGVTISRVSGASAGGPRPPDVFNLIPVLTLTSGTINDGTWQATLPIPSTYDGTWEITNVCVVDNADNETNVDPRQQGITRTFTVNGTDQPLLSALRFFPNPVARGQAVTVSGLLTDAETGQGIADTKIGVGQDEGCGPDVTIGSGVTTSPTGQWSDAFGVPDATGNGFICATLTAPEGLDLDGSTTPTDGVIAGQVLGHLRVRTQFLSARSASSSVRHGTNVSVTGAVWPEALFARVILQRLVSGTWRDVNQAPLRDSGRYTLVATPPRIGINTYRVHTPSSGCRDGVCRFVGSTSPTFVIRGT